jgi:hypothetical protein
MRKRDQGFRWRGSRGAEMIPVALAESSLMLGLPTQVPAQSMLAVRECSTVYLS